MFSHWEKSLDQKIYDFNLNYQQYEIDDDIVIIAIDERSIKELGRWPWPRDIHAEFFSNLTNYDIKAALVDILFSEKNISNLEKDLALIQSLKLHNVFLPVYIAKIEVPNNTERFYVQRPFEEIENVAQGLGHTHVYSDSDGLVRTVDLQLTYDGKTWSHLAYALYEYLHGTNKESFLDDRHRKLYIPFVNNQGSQYKILSYVDVLLGRVSTVDLKQKVVFIGATAPGLGDSIPTPLTGRQEFLSGIEKHANIYNGLSQSTMIKWAPEYISYVLMFFILLIVCISGFYLSVLGVFVVSVIQILLVLAASHIVLKYYFIWVPIADVIILLLLSYPLWSLYKFNQAVRSLSSELKTVKNIPSVLKEGLSLTDIKTKLNSFLEVGFIHSWWILIRGEAEVSFSGRKNESMDAKRITTYHLEIDDTVYIISCYWKNIRFKERYEAGLNKWDDDVVPKDHLIKAHSQIIHESIAFLNAANQQVVVSTEVAQSILKRFEGAILVTDMTGRLLFTNNKADEWFNVEKLPLDSKHIFSASTSFDMTKEERIELFKSIVFDEEKVKKEITTKDGGHYLLHAENITPYADHSKIIIRSLVDIALITRLLKSREEALRFLSHDLRSPMVSMIAMIDQFKNETKDDLKTLPSYDLIDKIEHIARKNLNLANDYLQIVRTEQGGVISLDLIDAAGIFENAMSKLFSEIKTKDISVNFNFPDEVIWVNSNSNLLERVLQNLIENAVKYSDVAGTIDLDIILSEQEVGFSIKDSGIGIPENEVNLVFDQFYRASNVSHNTEMGTGLGLKFVKTAVERLQGRVTMKSELHSGTVVCVWLLLC